jgi:hypothetical protein
LIAVKTTEVAATLKAIDRRAIAVRDGAPEEAQCELDVSRDRHEGQYIRVSG